MDNLLPNGCEYKGKEQCTDGLVPRALLPALQLASPSLEQAFPQYSLGYWLMELLELTSCVLQRLEKTPFSQTVQRQVECTVRMQLEWTHAPWLEDSTLAMLLLSTLCTFQNMVIFFRTIGCKVHLFWMSYFSIFARSIFPQLMGYICHMAKKNNCCRWKRLYSMTRTANFGL